MSSTPNELLAQLRVNIAEAGHPDKLHGSAPEFARITRQLIAECAKGNLPDAWKDPRGTWSSGHLGKEIREKDQRIEALERELGDPASTRQKAVKTIGELKAEVATLTTENTAFRKGDAPIFPLSEGGPGLMTQREYAEGLLAEIERLTAERDDLASSMVSFSAEVAGIEQERDEALACIAKYGDAGALQAVKDANAERDEALALAKAEVDRLKRYETEARGRGMDLLAKHRAAFDAEFKHKAGEVPDT